ncbi:hypothetical protein EVAR_12015_1 [Eumeta japonica]|uniref:Uncharacterized protein n=1 Tax=Eumeta variegata TaxID=151549 RepID=A0A4C1U603_EUMVA|nr:hypothetical protein EVAR_12015_1 [Eumeta japonica]
MTPLNYHVRRQAKNLVYEVEIQNRDHLIRRIEQAIMNMKEKNGFVTKQFTCRLCAAAFSLLFGRIGRWSGREIDPSQAERLGRSSLSIACSTLSFVRSAQAECDNE